MNQASNDTQQLPSVELLSSSANDTACNFHQPAWMRPYTEGTRNGYAQSVMAYADYYATDGSADTDHEIEERIAINRTPMIAYASRTGTKRNLEAMRQNGWRLLVSAKGVLRTEGFKYVSTMGRGLPSHRGSRSMTTRFRKHLNDWARRPISSLCLISYVADWLRWSSV
ncbi:hypothetical protein ACYSUW_13060 [Pseudomonas frederiksbergensis]